MAWNIKLEVELPVGTPYQGVYRLDLGECTGLDDLDVYRETGFTLVGLFRKTLDDPSFQSVLAPAIVWIERRRQFPATTFAMVAASIKAGSDYQIRDAPDELFDQDTDEGKAPSESAVSLAN